MSLINEALKRARDAQERESVDWGGAAFVPVPVLERARAGRSALWLAMMAVSPALLIALGAASLRWHRTSPEATGHSAPRPEAVMTVSRARFEAAPVVRRVVPETPEPIRAAPRMVPVPESPMALPRSVSPVAAVKPSASTAVRPRPEAAPIVARSSAMREPSGAAPGSLKLEAIHFRLKRPSVIINGKTLFQGSEIQGAKIVSIKRESVEILAAGKTSMLRRR